VARKKGSSVSPNKPDIPVGRYFLSEDAPWRGFLNLRLDDSHKQAFESWTTAYPNEPQRIFADLLAEGAKIGFSYDGANQCFITTITGALLDGDTGRYVMTTRAGTWADSLALACWKHDQLAQGDYGDYLPRSGTMQSWG